jgi:hypothetical protein
VTGAIVSIQIPGDRNHEKYLRTVTDDTRVETIREAVTAMMKKPSAHDRQQDAEEVVEDEGIPARRGSHARHGSGRDRGAGARIRSSIKQTRGPRA